jgi:catechol 2,3-dioxygenase-like lactoylglutathione lyase family enzyme
MHPHVSIITLGVTDVAKSTAFYRDTLGWKPTDASNEYITFIQMNGILLSLYQRDQLADDAEVEAAAPSDFPGFSLAHNLNSTAEVDELFEELKSRDVEIVKPPQKASWGGYSGYFSDPDGYLWEVAYNPFLHIDEDGNIGS